MQYAGCVSGADAELAIEREGLRLGSRFLDFADVKTLRPVNHRVQICTLSGEEIEISMLGFSFDGFWEELMTCFSDRSLEALFVEEKELMRTEGDYQTPLESGRAKIALYGDAVCILPQTMNAVRIPLCFAREIRLDGYRLTISLETGAEYTVARMGYDTKPFAERAQAASALVKKERAAAQAKLEDDIAAAPAVAPVGSARRHVKLTAKAHVAVAALAGFDIDLCVICKHGMILLQERPALRAGHAAWTGNYSFVTLGYTETFVLSLPRRSKRTTPSFKAKRVSSPPRPTFSPG